MNYQIMNHEYLNTGGHCMVSVFDVWLKDENRQVWLYVGCETNAAICTVDYLRHDIPIDNYDDITVDSVDFEDYSQIANSRYRNLFVECIWEFWKKDCKDAHYYASVCREMIPVDVYSSLCKADVKYTLDTIGYIATDGYNLYLENADGEEVTVSASVPQHKSLADTLAACLVRLQATYVCNHEVMDADDLGDLLTTIDDVKYYMTTED